MSLSTAVISFLRYSYILVSSSTSSAIHCLAHDLQWHNRTFYFGDDVTDDLVAAAAGNGSVVLAVELFKHWYALNNSFFHPAYGPRSFKAVLVLTHANGTTAHALATIPGPEGGWRHGSGSLTFDDLHHGQATDGRLATPGWESVDYKIDNGVWAVASSVSGTPGRLTAHPMPHTRVLERVRPLHVAAVPSAAPGTTYRFTLPFELAGFCTLLLPRGCSRGTSVQIRYGECVDPAANTLCPVKAEGTSYGRYDSYVCRGNTTGMGPHDVSWRHLAIGANTESGLEAFTPAFQFSAFKYVEVTYPHGASVAPPRTSSLTCLRIGTSFDWTGDVAVAAGKHLDHSSREDDRIANDLLDLATPPRIAHCGRVEENHNLTLGCTDGHAIEKVLFASFGTTIGNCSDGFGEGNCSTTGKIGSASTSMAVVEQACLGQSTCTVPATVLNFAGGSGPGSNPCPHVVKSLAAEIVCSGSDPPTCQGSCYDDTLKPAPTPAPQPPNDDTTAAERFNAVVNATRSTAIGNYVMDFPTDSPQEEKRGWTGDSLATHRTYAAFFDMRAAWIKWTEDQAYTSSMLSPTGTVPMTVPCLFNRACRNDPRGTTGGGLLTGMAWGSILPQLSAFTAAMTGDERYAARVAPFTGSYVALLQKYANNASYEFPELMNVSSRGDRVNVDKKGWPASSYGDWCPVNSRSGGCTSVSALLNSVYFILDVDAALALLRAAKVVGGIEGDGPSEAQLQEWVSQSRKSFLRAFLRHIVLLPNSTSVHSPSSVPVSGLAFRDVYPPNTTHHGNPNSPPSVQVEAASGMAAMDPALQASNTRAELGEMLAGLVLNMSTDDIASTVGGVIDMAQIGRSLISYGRPDALFALISSNGSTSFYHMARSTGTIWAHPGAGDGHRGRCTSHGHIMQGGSIGEAVYGIGGIRPSFVHGNNRKTLVLAPVPWLPDAPLGSAVWRSTQGVASTRWAVRGSASTNWSVWVNVTVPAGGGTASVKVMLPSSARQGSVCAWECGFNHPVLAAPFTRHWISFGSANGFNRFTAVAPSPMSASAPDMTSCIPVWSSGASALPAVVAGIEDVTWVSVQPGYTMFPDLTLTVSSGDYAFFAQSC